MTRPYFLFSFTLVFILSLSATTGAQVTIGLSPTRGEHHLDPGEKHTDAFTLNNAGDTPTMITISVSDWAMDDKANVLFEAGGKRTDSASKWIKINPRNFILGPEDQKQVRYTLEVPEGTPEEGFRTAIRIRAAPADPSGAPSLPGKKKGRIEVLGEFIYYVYLTVGHPEPRARLKGFDAMKGPDGLETTFVVENPGKVHFRTSGFIEIRNEKDRLVAEKEVPSVPVLPDMTRSVSIPWPGQELSNGKYSVRLRLDIGRKELLGDDVTLEIRDGP